MSSGSLTSDEPSLFRDSNLYIIASVTLMAVMGISSITPAFPSIQEHFGVTEQQIGWLITIFTVPGIALNPVTGVLADRWGRKRVLLPLLFLFCGAGLACIYSETYNQLLTMRFFQGVGGSSLGPINAALVGDLYKGQRRTQVMGYIGGVISIGATIYPALGGVLAFIDWWGPFLLPLLALPVIFFVAFVLDNPHAESEMEPMYTYLGKVLKAFLYKETLGLFVLAILTFVILFGTYMNYLPFLIKERIRDSSIIIALYLSVMSLTTAVFSSQLGRFAYHFKRSSLLMVGTGAYALALFIIPFVYDFWILFLPIILFGIGHGLNLANIISLLTDLAPIQQRAAYLSINGMVLRVGQTMGPPLMAFVFGIWGLGGTFFCGSVLALVMVGTTFFTLRSVG